MITKRAVLIALSLWLAWAGSGAAQDSGRIEGQVRRADGVQVGGVTVRVDELDLELSPILARRDRDRERRDDAPQF